MEPGPLGLRVYAQPPEPHRLQRGACVASYWLTCGTSSLICDKNGMLPFSLTLKTILTVILAAVTEIMSRI